MAALMPQGKQQYFTAGGIPLVGGKVYTYAAGTTTPLATYTTAAASTPNANPVILDSRGEASIFFSAANYKIVVKDSLDSTIWTQDNLAGDLTGSLALSTGSSLVGHISAGTGAVATTVQSVLREMVSVKRFGAVGDGTTDDSAAITLAITSAATLGVALYFPAGTYKTTVAIPLVSNTHFYAHGDVTITSTLPTVAASYIGLFVAGAAVSNISSKGLKFSNTVAKGFAVFYSLYPVTNLELRENECTGCALIFAFDGATRARIQDNVIRSPVTEGTFDDYSRAILISWTATAYSSVVVTGNIILGSWTHGINIEAGDISVQTDPTVAKNANDVVVTNNVVVAVYSASAISAGGIWFSQVQGITVTGNVVENYGDVGIDFEACTNAVASGNILRNNNKNLALYGNNLNVRFEGNVCTNTVTGLIQVWNTYANSYSVDTRNTQIVFSGNTFSSMATSATGAEQIVLGTAGLITFEGNKIYNCYLNGTYLSLKEVVIADNDIFLDYFSSGTNLQNPIGIVQEIKSTDPFYGVAGGLYCTVKNNRIRINNVNASVYPIRWRMSDVTTGTISFNYTIIITDNEISINAPVPTQAISVEFVTTSVLTAYYQSVQVKRNKVDAPILLTVPNVIYMTPTVQIADNASQNGLPYYESRSTTGALTRYATSILTTAGSGIYWSLADGQYVGQSCLIQLGVYGGGTATVIVANHDLGINQNGTLTAAGQFFLLVWHGTAWSTIKSTGSGL